MLTATPIPINYFGNTLSPIFETILLIALFIIPIKLLFNLISVPTKKKSHREDRAVREVVYYSREVTFEPVHSGFLLSKSEFEFYKVLLSALEGENLIVFSKVRLGDLVKVAADSDGWAYGHNEINRKHIDFVICDGTNSKVLFAIELDDNSHEKEYRQKGDQIKDKALTQAGIALFRQKVTTKYDVESISKLIMEYLN